MHINVKNKLFKMFSNHLLSRIITREIEISRMSKTLVFVSANVSSVACFMIKDQ